MKNYLLKLIVIGSVFAAQQLVALGSTGCVNGRWEEDTCVCSKGYETVPRVTTEPSYCTKRSVVVIHIVNSSPWNHRDVLDLILPIFSVYILGCCFVGVVYTIWQIGLKFWSKETLRRLKLERAEFNKMIKNYKNVKMLDADVWVLPPMDYFVLNSVEGEHIIQYKRAKVLLDYKAQDAEELNLKKGDIIVDIIELENGWWQGDLNGQIGYFPGDYVKFLDNTKKTGSAIEMNDPEWTQGIQETAKTLQYKRTDGKESKKRDDEIVSETSSMYVKDLAEMKKNLDSTPKKKWKKKSSEDVTVVAKRKAKHKTAKEDEERLLISSDSRSMLSEDDTGKKDRRKKQKEKRRKDKDQRKQTVDTKETHVEDSELSFIEKDSQLSEERESRQKKSQGRKHGKQTEVTKDSKQNLLETDSQMSAEKTQEKQKVMEKERKNKEQGEKRKDKRKEEKQSLKESESQASIDRKNTKKRDKQHGRKDKYQKMSLVGSDIELSDETHFKDRKEGKYSKRKRNDGRTSDQSSTIKKAKSVESIERKQRSRMKGAQSEKQQSMTQSDTSDEKRHKKRRKSAKESKRKQKKILSDESSESDQPSVDKKHREKRIKEKHRRRNEQKALSQSTEIETSSEQNNKKSKGKRSQEKQPKHITESSDDNFDDEPSVTISDIQFLTESEEEKPKKGFFKKVFKF